MVIWHRQDSSDGTVTGVIQGTAASYLHWHRCLCLHISASSNVLLVNRTALTRAIVPWNIHGAGAKRALDLVSGWLPLAAVTSNKRVLIGHGDNVERLKCPDESSAWREAIVRHPYNDREGVVLCVTPKLSVQEMFFISFTHWSRWTYQLRQLCVLKSRRRHKLLYVCDGRFHTLHLSSETEQSIPQLINRRE